MRIALCLLVVWIPFLAFAQDGKISLGKKGNSTQDSTVQNIPISTPIDSIELAQNMDSKAEPIDTIPKTFFIKKWFGSQKKAPLKATVFSLVVPGSGQIYNKNYWKLPFVVGGFGAMGYFIARNTREHRIYKQAFLFRVDDDIETVDNFPELSESGLTARRDEFRRRLELSYIGLFAVYFLTATDAFVTAHLSTFDVSDDLSIRILPSFTPTYDGQLTPGLSFQFLPKQKLSPLKMAF